MVLGYAIVKILKLRQIQSCNQLSVDDDKLTVGSRQLTVS
jgi:hypothetical protein